MKADELMIGDWVNFLIDIEGGDTEYDQKNEVYQFMQVRDITSFGVNDGEVTSYEDVVNDIAQLQPIPLTAEILEKNGFNKCVRTREWTNDDVDFILYEKLDGIFRIQNTAMVLYHVHELQHALLLCGIDKEITL